MDAAERDRQIVQLRTNYPEMTPTDVAGIIRNRGFRVSVATVKRVVQESSAPVELARTLAIRPPKLSRKQKAEALVEYGECASMKEAYTYLADMGE